MYSNQKKACSPSNLKERGKCGYLVVLFWIFFSMGSLFSTILAIWLLFRYVWQDTIFSSSSVLYSCSFTTSFSVLVFANFSKTWILSFKLNPKVLMKDIWKNNDYWLFCTCTCNYHRRKNKKKTTHDLEIRCPAEIYNTIWEWCLPCSESFKLTAVLPKYFHLCDISLF